LGKAIVNAPLFKCAVAGNDPNVGRLVQAIGKYVGASAPDLDLSSLNIRLGGLEIFSKGVFQLDPTKEAALVAHFRSAELYESAAPQDGVFAPPIDFPRHERCVEIELNFDLEGARPGLQQALLQRLSAEGKDATLATTIARDHFALLARRRVAELAAQTGATEKEVQQSIDELARLNLDPGPVIVLGGDLTHEYVSENADYRS
jgi:N-acetylglutamate synthase/N-acetylornithine aminotransferase